MFRRFTLFCAVAVILFVASTHTRAQENKPQQTPTPTPQQREEQEPVKVFTEEVRLPVVAYDSSGHFDPTLQLEEVLVLEDGVPQQIRSIRRIPASVLLVLDTGGEMNPAMRISTTRALALNLVSHLSEGDQISVIQFSKTAEVIQGWTTETEQIEYMLRRKLSSGRGSHLAAAINTAAEQFQNQPFGNRHIVIVTDGVDLPGRAGYSEAMQELSDESLKKKRAELSEAIKRLNEAQATVHVISYTALGRKVASEREKSDRIVSTSTQPGDINMSTVGIDPTLPPGTSRSPSVGFGIRFDPQMRKLKKAYERAMKRSEQQLGSLAEEMGGRIWLPLTPEQMLAQGAEVARDIGAQYVITYTPKRPLAQAQPGEYRRIEIAPRRVGLRLRSRRGYIVR
ncbi:MAG: VWA domain-containing protein [Pyrinomonadaceae bacterium]